MRTFVNALASLFIVGLSYFISACYFGLTALGGRESDLWKPYTLAVFLTAVSCLLIYSIWRPR